MLKPIGRTLEFKQGKAHILEGGRLQELRLAHSPEVTILNPIFPDIVQDFATDHVEGSQRLCNVHTTAKKEWILPLCKLSEM